jgi:hypothetical protein
MARVRIKRVSVLAVALWHSLYALIFALFLSLVYLAYYYLSLGYIPARIWYYLAIVPAAYCPLGFVAYGLVALIYNATAQNTGGVTMELEETVDDAPPPPPSF